MSATYRAEMLIEKTRQKLISKAKKSGLYENFGQKEYGELKERLNYSPYGTPTDRDIAAKIDNFEEWASIYCG